MAVVGALGLGAYMLHLVANRSFAVTFADGEIVYPEFAYPLGKEIIPLWLASLLTVAVPVLGILLVQIRVCSCQQRHHGPLCSLITAAVFQVFIKWLIGDLRPYFLDVCKPDTSLATDAGYNKKGFQQQYFAREICTGDEN